MTKNDLSTEWLSHTDLIMYITLQEKAILDRYIKGISHALPLHTFTIP